MSLHILIRWQARHNPRSIEAHKDVADQTGSVWWGLLDDPGSSLTAPKLTELYTQIATESPTYVWFVGISGLWRADLIDITSDISEINQAQIPSYYDPAWAPELWLRLANFVQIYDNEGQARSWAINSLRLSDSGQAPDFTTPLTLFPVRNAPDFVNPMPVVTPPAPPQPALVSERQSVEFTVDTLAEAIAVRNLKMDKSVIAALVAALTSGKHVILTGPPGTGKTTLAQLTAEHAAKTGLCTGFTLTTATADWTTYETIGGLVPDQTDGSLTFRPGHFLVAARDDKWLIIDELNRSNFDRAFGQLFTVLSGQSVVLPYLDPRGRPYAINAPLTPLPYDPHQNHVLDISPGWRIVATMNVFDKSLLFEMSFALMRRFAFIEVPAPSNAVFRELWLQQLIGLPENTRDTLDSVLWGLTELRELKDLGPAVFIDMGRFAARFVDGDTKLDPGAVAFQLFYSFLLPQFEGIDRGTGQTLYEVLAPQVGAQRQPRLREVLNEVLGLVVEALPGEFDDLGADEFGEERIG